MIIHVEHDFLKIGLGDEKNIYYVYFALFSKENKEPIEVRELQEAESLILVLSMYTPTIWDSERSICPCAELEGKCI